MKKFVIIQSVILIYFMTCSSVAHGKNGFQVGLGFGGGIVNLKSDTGLTSHTTGFSEVEFSQSIPSTNLRLGLKLTGFEMAPAKAMNNFNGTDIQFVMKYDFERLGLSVNPGISNYRYSKNSQEERTRFSSGIVELGSHYAFYRGDAVEWQAFAQAKIPTDHLPGIAEDSLRQQYGVKLIFSPQNWVATPVGFHHYHHYHVSSFYIRPSIVDVAYVFSQLGIKLGQSLMNVVAQLGH